MLKLLLKLIVIFEVYLVVVSAEDDQAKEWMIEAINEIFKNIGNFVELIENNQKPKFVTKIHKVDLLISCN